MNLTFHHLKKDIRCLRLLLSLWFVLLVINSLLMRSGVDRFAVTSESGQALAIAHSLLYALQQLLQIVMVCQVVHLDALAGTTAFWLTRPVSRKELLLSKCLFVLLILVLPVLLVECVVMWLNVIPVQDWPAALAELVILQCSLFIMPAMLLAALTPNLARLSVTALVSLIAFFLLHYTVLTTVMTFGGVIRTEPAVTAGLLLAAILVVGSCATLIAVQYSSRKTAQAVAGAILAMILLIATMNFWRWDFLTPTATLPSQSPLNPDHVNLVLQRDARTTSFESHPRLRDAAMQKIMGRFEFLGVPPGFFVELVGLQVTLEFPDGKVIPSGSENQSGWAGLFYFYFERYQKAIGDFLQSLHTAIVLNKPHLTADPTRFALLSVDLSTFQNYKHTPAIYKADAELRAHQYQLKAALPLRPGSRYVDDSGETTLLALAPHPDGWILTMRESSVRRWIQSKPPKGVFYVLRNRTTKEALLGRSYPENVFGRFPALYRVVVNHSPIYFTTTGVSDYQGPPINEAWLREAELLRVEIRTIGNFTKSIRAEGFVMDPS
ncbi:MAG TPA: hypothetical protein VFJ27_03900 [Terriglobia bacterium]|nr:hypothetical protein [Terriglobia bacterium]